MLGDDDPAFAFGGFEIVRHRIGAHAKHAAFVVGLVIFVKRGDFLEATGGDQDAGEFVAKFVVAREFLDGRLKAFDGLVHLLGVNTGASGGDEELAAFRGGEDALFGFRQEPLVFGFRLRVIAPVVERLRKHQLQVEIGSVARARNFIRSPVSSRRFTFGRHDINRTSRSVDGYD